MKQPINAFLDHFGGLEDRREAGKILHPLPEILLVTLCGVLAGAEGFEDIEDYGESKLDLLRQLLPFAHGVPSDDTLRRVFRGIDSPALQGGFFSFVRDLLFPAHCPPALSGFFFCFWARPPPEPPPASDCH